MSKVTRVILSSLIISQASFGQSNQLGISSSEIEKKISSKLDADERILKLADLDADSRKTFKSFGDTQGPGIVCGTFDSVEFSCGVLTVSKKASPHVARRFLFFKNISEKGTSPDLVEDFKKDKALRTNVFLSFQKKTVLKNRGEGPDSVVMPFDGINRTIEGQSNVVIFFKGKELMKIWTSD